MPDKEDRPPSPRRSQTDLRSIPARQYLDQKIIPVLLSGLSELVRERPADAAGYLASYLLQHRENSTNGVDPN